MAFLSDPWKASVVGERHYYIPGVAITLEVVSTILFALRLFARLSWKSGGKPGVDDIFLIAGWALGTALTVFVIIAADDDGYDRHTFEMEPSKYPKAVFIGWLCNLLFILSTSSTKISVLLLYQRLISPFQNRALLWTIRCTLFCVGTYMLAFFLVPLVACTPFDATWMRYDPGYTTGYTCRVSETARPISAAISTVTDLVAVIIPLAILYSLRRPLRQKAGLYAVFAIGFLVVGAGVARTVFSFQLMHTPRDFTWLGSLVLLASLFEHHLALICACAPSLRPLFSQEVIPKLKTITRNAKSLRKHPNIKHCLRIASPDINETAPRIRSPSFDVVHTIGLGSGITDEEAGFVAVAYEPDDLRNDLNKERRPDTPKTPILTQPERVLRMSGLSAMSRFAGPSLKGPSSPRAPSRGGEIRSSGIMPMDSRSPLREEYTTVGELGSEYDLGEKALPDLPSDGESAIDPALSPGFVACRGCGKYHRHGFRHDDEKRGSGTMNWWKKTTRRESPTVNWWRANRKSIGLGRWRDDRISVFED